MLLRPGSRLTDSGRPTPCWPSWRACDYADKPSRENQRSIANDGAPQVRRGIIRQSALHRGAGIEESDPASQELAVLQEPEWGADGRPVHELDSHLRAKRSQSLRLSHRVAAARRGVEANTVGVDALELPRDAGTDRRPLGCGVEYAEFCLAEKDHQRP